MGEVIFPELKEDLRGVGGERAANLVVENVEEMIEELGLPSKLSDFGVKETDLEMMASEAMKQTRLLPNNPRDIGGGDAVGIYSSIL